MKKIWESPYDYVINNPILRFDPNGLTDFKMNKETGVVNQVGDPNDDRDRILKTDKNGNVKKRGDGLFGFMGKKENKDKPRIAIKDIAKGILSDGMNLKTDSHVIDVNGNGQPTTNEVERFTFEVSNYVNTEISGYLLSDQGSTSTNHVYINGYINNDDQNCNNNGFMLRSVRPDLFNRINRNMTYFHTHLSVFNDDARLNASRADLTFKEDQLNNGVNRFLIITNPEPLEHEYQ